MNIIYKFRKLIILFKQRNKRRRQASALKKMNSEQMKAFNMVKSFAVKHNDAIRFDPYSDEILILLPKMLITLKNDTIYVHNTTGFLTIPIETAAYEMLVDIIHIESHKERRKLKYEVKQRINDFLTKISESDNDLIN